MTTSNPRTINGKNDMRKHQYRLYVFKGFGVPEETESDSLDELVAKAEREYKEDTALAFEIYDLETGACVAQELGARD
jgi:hypothetical protein